MQSIDKLLKLINHYYKLAAKLDIGGSTPSMSYDPNFTGIVDRSDPFPPKVEIPSIEDKAKSFKYLQRKPDDLRLLQIIIKMTEYLSLLNEDIFNQIIVITTDNISISKSYKEYYRQLLRRIKALNNLVEDINATTKLASSEIEINKKDFEIYINHLNDFISYFEKYEKYFLKIKKYNELLNSLYSLRTILLDAIEKLNKADFSGLFNDKDFEEDLSFKKDKPEEKTKPIL